MCCEAVRDVRAISQASGRARALGLYEYSTSTVEYECGGIWVVGVGVGTVLVLVLVGMGVWVWAYSHGCPPPPGRNGGVVLCWALKFKVLRNYLPNWNEGWGEGKTARTCLVFLCVCCVLCVLYFVCFRFPGMHFSVKEGVGGQFLSWVFWDCLVFESREFMGTAWLCLLLLYFRTCTCTACTVQYPRTRTPYSSGKNPDYESRK